MVRRLLYLNGLAVLAVVFYHSSAWGFISMFWWTHRYRPVTVPNFDQFGSLSYFGLRLVEQLIIFAIPAFLFVSGYFISIATGRRQSTIGWNLVGTRIKNLIIPYLIWSIIIISLLAIEGTRYTRWEFLTLILLGQAAAPYYFVPLLVQFYLLSPVIVLMIKSKGKLFLLLAALIQVMILSTRYSAILGFDNPIMEFLSLFNKSYLVPGQIFWFSFGIYVGFHPDILKQFLNKVKWLLLSLAVLTFFIGVFEWEVLLHLSGQDWISPRETLVDHLYAGAIILTYLAFEKFNSPFSAQLQNIGTKSYGVYLIHAPVLQYTARIVYHIMPGLFAYQFVFQIVLIVLGLGIPLLMMTFVNKSPARRYYEYAFGR
jgi:membrane-bound acyltransferase YfiQ involved in biofilm formation